jgi:hypothetical protein
MDKSDASRAINSSVSAAGAVYEAVYVERKVMIYGVTDHELRTISFANTAATVTFSAMTFCLTAALSMWIAAATVNGPSGTVNALSHIVAPLCLALALVFALAGVIAIRYRGGEIKRIREESGANGDRIVT